MFSASPPRDFSISFSTLSAHEESMYELRKHIFAVYLLLNFDLTDPNNRKYFNDWYGLLCDHIDIINQHCIDLENWENAVRKGKEFS